MGRFELRSYIPEDCVLLQGQMVYLLCSPEKIERSEPSLWRYEEHCWILFETFSYAEKHAHQSHPDRDQEKTIICSLCQRPFARDADLTRHVEKKPLESVKIIDAKPSNPKRPLPISVSDLATFTDSAAMTTRWQDDEGERYVCESWASRG